MRLLSRFFPRKPPPPNPIKVESVTADPPKDVDPRAAFEILYRRRDELRLILLQWDPIGTQAFEDPGPTDEYDCLINPIIGAVIKGASEGEIAGLLNNELEEHFGLSRSPESAAVAARIMNWAIR